MNKNVFNYQEKYSIVTNSSDAAMINKNEEEREVRYGRKLIEELYRNLGK